MKLEQIIKAVSFSKKYNFKNITIKKICIDSNEVIDNSLFIAKPGNVSDGHKYINDAIKKGAKVIIYSKALKEKDDSVIWLKIKKEDTEKIIIKIAKNFYMNPEKQIKIIGITGTNGKTTTSFIIEQILHKNHIKSLVIGTLNARIGKTVYQLKNTTPDAITIYRLLREAVKKKCEYAVLEISSAGIIQKRLDLKDVYIAIFTNLTPEHLDFHKTLINYAKAKSLLFKSLKKSSYSIINIDDGFSDLMRQQNNSKIIEYSVDKNSENRANIIISNKNGSIIKLHNNIYHSPLIGKYNVSNLSSALIVAEILKLDKNKLAKAIASLKSVPGRLEKIRLNKKGIDVYIDYAHTPDALEKVLHNLKGISDSKIITVFGCGGNRDKVKRPKMGAIAIKYSDLTVITSDNPRFEQPEEIIKDILVDIKKEHKKYYVEMDRYKAITYALKTSENTDIVLVAGKGHEDYQIIKNEKKKFSDSDVVKKIAGENNWI